MTDKIALVSCSGLSPLGLVVRAASVELALENDNIVAACITEYSAQPNNCSPILDDAKIVTIVETIRTICVVAFLACLVIYIVRRVQFSKTEEYKQYKEFRKALKKK